MPRSRRKEPNLAQRRWSDRPRNSTSPIKKAPIAPSAKLYSGDPSSPLSSPLRETPPSSILPDTVSMVRLSNPSPNRQESTTLTPTAPSSPLSSPPAHFGSNIDLSVTAIRSDSPVTNLSPLPSRRALRFPTTQMPASGPSLPLELALEPVSDIPQRAIPTSSLSQLPTVSLDRSTTSSSPKTDQITRLDLIGNSSLPASDISQLTAPASPLAHSPSTTSPRNTRASITQPGINTESLPPSNPSQSPQTQPLLPSSDMSPFPTAISTPLVTNLPSSAPLRRSTRSSLPLARPSSAAVDTSSSARMQATVVPLVDPASPTKKARRTSTRLMPVSTNLPASPLTPAPSNPRGSVSCGPSTKRKRQSDDLATPAHSGSSKRQSRRCAEKQRADLVVSEDPMPTASPSQRPPPSSPPKPIARGPKRAKAKHDVSAVTLSRSSSPFFEPAYSYDSIHQPRAETPVRQRTESPDLTPPEPLDFNGLWRPACAEVIEKRRAEAEAKARELQAEALEEAQEKKRKLAYKPSVLPDRVSIGITCLCFHQRAWTVSALLEFKPSAIRASEDRYVVEVHLYSTKTNAVTEIVTVPRNKIRFTDEAIVKTMDKTGSRKRVINDLEDVDAYPMDAVFRALTPPPELTSPDARPVPFAELSLQQQLYHIRPHLHRVIKDEYAPAMKRIHAFYVSHTMDMRAAKYSDAAMAMIGIELRRWALREGKPRDGTSHPPRPTGSETYEAYDLEILKKYCTGVLIIEAIIRIDILLSTDGVEPQEADEQAEYNAALARLKDIEKEKWKKGQWDLRFFEANSAMGAFLDEAERDRAVQELVKQGIYRVTGRGRLIVNTEKQVEINQEKKEKRKERKG